MTTDSGSTDSGRLRPHPSKRFEGDEHFFDLSAVIRRLRDEPFAGERGHKQVTIFKRSPVTQIVFVFKAGASLPDHRAQGLVTIQALEGRLTARAQERDYEMTAGSILNLAPGIPHDVTAHEASAILVTVHLEAKSSS